MQCQCWHLFTTDVLRSRLSARRRQQRGGMKFIERQTINSICVESAPQPAGETSAVRPHGLLALLTWVFAHCREGIARGLVGNYDRADLFSFLRRRCDKTRAGRKITTGFLHSFHAAAGEGLLAVGGAISLEWSRNVLWKKNSAD